jgi:hypothetical protein
MFVSALNLVVCNQAIRPSIPGPLSKIKASKNNNSHLRHHIISWHELKITIKLIKRLGSDGGNAGEERPL